MTNTKQKIIATLGLAGAVALSTTLSVATKPDDAGAYSLLGHSLSIFERDFRVNNNFTDGTANNNTTPHPNFPGHTGAVMAIWKGAIEWASGGHGDGTGDVSGNFLGSGGANYDAHFQGTTTSTGSFTNIHRELSGSSGSTLAFMQGGSFGWHVRYYSTWTWQDGPGFISGGSDLQGIACHEHGHALGMGHSNSGGSPTMQPGTANGFEQRSLHSDDIAGVQAIYGSADPLKPNIGSISGTLELGSALTINGINFTSTNNQVWFTNQNSSGEESIIFGVPSPSGTSLTVNIPGNAVDGHVLVRRNATGHFSLSDAFPLNIDEGGAQLPILSLLDPNSGAAAGWTPVDIEGFGFLGTISVTFDGVPAQSFVVVNDGLIQAVSPPGTFGESVDVVVTNDDGPGSLVAAYTYSFNGFMDIDTVDPASGSTVGGELVTISGPNTVPVFFAQFDGVSGTNLEIQSATEFTVETPAAASDGLVDVFVQGSGGDTLVAGYEYINEGAFNNIGPGLGGGAGVPLFTGVGDASPGGAGFTLNVLDAPSSAGGSWFIGLELNPLPFKQGTLYPVPWLVQVPIVTGVDGTMVIPGAVDVSIPSGLSVIMQMWFTDATGPAGFTATNGLEMVIP